MKYSYRKTITACQFVACKHSSNYGSERIRGREGEKVREREKEREGGRRQKERETGKDRLNKRNQTALLFAS